MYYRLNDEFQKIEQMEGIMQNLNRRIEIEIVACAGEPKKDSGLLLLPLEKMKFTAREGESIYARCTEIDGRIANLSVASLTPSTVGGSGMGCNCCVSIIDDALTVLDKTWSSKKINETFTKYYTKKEVDDLLNALPPSDAMGNYTQVTKLGVEAPEAYVLPIQKTDTFNLPPAEVLKLVASEQNVVTTVCEFEYDDAQEYIVGGVSGEEAPYVEFDGTMHLKTKYDIAMSQPGVVGSGYLSQSAEIVGLNGFKTLVKLEIEEE